MYGCRQKYVVVLVVQKKLTKGEKKFYRWSSQTTKSDFWLFVSSREFGKCSSTAELSNFFDQNRFKIDIILAKIF